MTKPRYHGIIDRKDLVREVSSKAVLSRDAEALNRYKAERSQALKTNNIASRVENLENSVSDIKTLLEAILTKLS